MTAIILYELSIQSPEILRRNAFLPLVNINKRDYNSHCIDRYQAILVINALNSPIHKNSSYGIYSVLMVTGVYTTDDFGMHETDGRSGLFGLLIIPVNVVLYRFIQQPVRQAIDVGNLVVGIEISQFPDY